MPPIMIPPAALALGVVVLLALGVLLGIWIRKQAEKKAELTIADAEKKAANRKRRAQAR